jgi:hypothetical protein
MDRFVAFADVRRLLRNSDFPPPPRSGGEGLRVGGCAANAAVSELVDRLPPPPPQSEFRSSRPTLRANARGGRGEEDEFEFQTASRVPAARCARVFQNLCPPSKQRAQGKPGVQCTRGRACSVESTRVSHHEFTGNIRLSPRNGFNGLFRALPGDRALLPPSPAN